MQGGYGHGHPQQPPQPYQQPTASQAYPSTMQASTSGVTAEGIKWEIVGGTSYAMLVLHLQPGQAVTAEPGAMAYMTRTVEIETHARGGSIVKGLKTKLLGGESLMVNTYTAKNAPGEIGLVGSMIGDIRAINLTGNGMVIQKGSYLAATPGVNIDTTWQGLKTFASEGGFFMLHASGNGTVWVTSFGAIVERYLQYGEMLAVDTGHLVAWPDNIQFSVRRVGGWKSTLLSGEGFVTDLVGPGVIYMQTRTLPQFVQIISGYLGR